MHYDVRKWYGSFEDVLHEGGSSGESSLRKAVVAVVIHNPFSGRYVDDLSGLTDSSDELGFELAERAKVLLEGQPVESYGKGGLAGVNGEQEHIVACITTVFGDALRKGVGGGKAWISSSTKVGFAGEILDIPLAYKDALYVRSHYDTVTLRIPDAPRPDELVIAVAVATGGRVHHRTGGLAKEEAVKDGLR
jgi:hypothetical protein